MRTKKVRKKTYKRRAATMNEIDTYLTIDGYALKDERLKDFNIKALYCRIKMYVNLKPDGSCFATNETLSKYIGKSPAWIANKISLLKKLKYIYEDNFDGRQRHLKLCKLKNSLLKKQRQPSKNYKADKILPSSYKTQNDEDNSHGTNPMDKKSSTKSPFKKPYQTKHLNLSVRLLKYQNKERPKMLRQITPQMRVNGALEIEKLERIDKFDFKTEIKPAILWAVKDSFWGRNILSAASIRIRGNNGQTKFQNMFNSFVESYEKSKPSLSSKDQKIIDVVQKDYHPFTEDELYPSIPRMRKAYRKLSTAPNELTDFTTFVWEFIKFLKSQEWITDPHPAIFNPEGKVWPMFIEDLKDNRMIM